MNSTIKNIMVIKSENKMTHKEALIYIFDILNKYWGETHDEGLGDLLSDLNPAFPNDVGITADPAAWYDWQKAIKGVTPCDNITEEQAFKAIIVLMKNYYKKFHDPESKFFDLKEVIEHLEKQKRI